MKALTRRAAFFINTGVYLVGSLQPDYLAMIAAMAFWFVFIRTPLADSIGGALGRFWPYQSRGGASYVMGTIGANVAIGIVVGVFRGSTVELVAGAVVVGFVLGFAALQVSRPSGYEGTSGT